MKTIGGMKMRSTTSPRLSQWLPDRQLMLIWLFCVVIAACAWLYLLLRSETAGGIQGTPSLSALGASVTLLGVAYGSFLAALFVALRAFLGQFKVASPLSLSASSALRVALVMFVVHILGFGLLGLSLHSLGGHWQPPGQWYLGLLPYLWH